MRWLHYALGGGAGHLTRAYALARPALAAGHEVEILAGGSFCGWLVERLRGLPGLTVTHLEAGLGKAASDAAVRARVRRGGFDRLIVDTFPRGLAGELAEVLAHVRCPRVLVARALVPAYASRPEVRRARDTFDRLLVPGAEATFADHPRAHVTAPWLVRDARELLPGEEARRRLGATDERPIALVLGTGTSDECGELAALASAWESRLRDRICVRWLGPGRVQWPALELLAGVDVLVASAGCNTVVEARATGTPLFARVRGRLYDDQSRRVRLAETWTRPEDLELRLAAVARRAAAPIDYRNGAADAAALVEGTGPLPSEVLCRTECAAR